jgi:hypothetical protein
MPARATVIATIGRAGLSFRYGITATACSEVAGYVVMPGSQFKGEACAFLRNVLAQLMAPNFAQPPLTGPTQTVADAEWAGIRRSGLRG